MPDWWWIILGAGLLLAAWADSSQASVVPYSSAHALSRAGHAAVLCPVTSKDQQ
jgi:hypothetical protein